MRTTEIENTFSALLSGCGAAVDAAASADEAAAQYPLVTVECTASSGAGFGETAVCAADVSVSLSTYRDDDQRGAAFLAISAELENRLFAPGLVARLANVSSGKIAFFGASEVESFDASDVDVRSVVWQLRVFFSPLE